EPFDLHILLTNVCASAQAKAENRLVTVTASLWDVPPLIYGMEARMAQVFNNLIDNAVSFSKPGDEIKVSTKPQNFNGYPAMKIEVLDQGPGIPAENLESIFNRFYSERPQAEEFGNHSGLGLSICRQIVNAHEGKIWAENRNDRSGARFSVLLPL
nr:histidine kinase [Paracoccaceae bacterium]